MYEGLLHQSFGDLLASAMYIDPMDPSSSGQHKVFFHTQPESAESMSEIIDANDEIEQTIRRIDRARNFLRRIRTNFKGKRLIHDIVSDLSESRNSRLLREVCRHEFANGFFMWIWHLNHAHIVHDCSWTGGYCKCRRLQGIPSKRTRRMYRKTKIDPMEK
jgi:hypothetical protein